MDGVVRKVVVGDIKNGMSYSVGQRFDKVGDIAEIYIDDDFYEAYGIATVVVTVDDGNAIEEWKRFPLVTCNLEYELE